jgi:DNA repair protein RadD
MILREYQQRTIDQLYAWFSSGNTGHPCLVMPTGSGKSVIIAALCRDALQNWPETRVLMLTHVKELIEQNYSKMRAVWPNAPVGIYSSSIGRKELGEPITFAGIQSIRNKADSIGHVDLIIVDECHTISHKDDGGYRGLIGELTKINPHLRVIGLTATPWRLGHGRICDGSALFSDLIEPVSIEELLYLKHLAPLHSKRTDFRLSTDGVHKRGGEFIESELQAAVDTALGNAEAVDEIIARAGDRKAWLIFCTGVAHARHIKDAMIERGIAAECVTGDTPKGERSRMLDDFKAGRIQAMTNANVLTTGFDYPDIDLIAMLRPTMSPSLYVQMAGRGLRPKSHTDHCLVLDFAANVETHGPITNVREPAKKGDAPGEAPVKVCPECQELVAIAVRLCPTCGYEFPPPAAKTYAMSNADIMRDEPDKSMAVTSWQMRPHTSYSSGKDMIRITYYGALSDKPIHEYLTVFHEGYAGEKAARTLAKICQSAGIDANSDDWRGWCDYASIKGKPPSSIDYTIDGKFARITRRNWG